MRKTLHSYMNMYVLLPLVVGLLFLSMWIKPDNKEIALMEWQDANYQEARSRYDALRKDGNYSLNVVIPLIKLHVRAGEMDQAIALLEEYVARNPKHVNARKELAALYEADQRFSSYIRALEDLQNLEPSVKTLRRLAEMYDYTGRYDEQANALERMYALDKKSLTEEEYLQLANYHAVRKEPDQALSVLLYIAKKEDYRIGSATLNAMLRLAFQLNKPEDAFEYASAYLEEMKNARDAVDIAYMFAQQGYPEQATKLLSPFEEQIRSNPLLYTRVIALKGQLGGQDEAYKEMQAQYEQGTLDPSLTEEFLSLALQYKNEALFSRVLRTVSLVNVSEQAVWDFLALAAANKNTEIAGLLHERMKEFSFDVPALMKNVLVLLARQEPKALQAVLASSHSAATEQQKLIIGQLCLQQEKYAQAYGLLEGVAPENMLAALGHWQTATLYIQTSQMQQGLKKFAYAIQTPPSEPLSSAQQTWLLIAASAGKQRDIAKWLKNYEQVDSALLADMYGFAQSARHYQDALESARELYRRDESADNRIQLAEALIYAGKPQEALVHINALGKTPSERLRQLAVLAIVEGAKQGTLSMRERRDLLTLLPAHDRLNSTQKSELGYALLAAGLNEQARAIFMPLANNRPFTSDEVQQALALFGEEPDQAALDWVSARAATSPTEEQGLWLDYLNQHKAYTRVIDLFPMADGKVSEAVMEPLSYAMLKSGKRKELSALIEASVQHSGNPAYIKSLARIAEDANLKDTASQAWLKLHALQPEDAQANRALGLEAYSRNQYDKAYAYLEAYIPQIAELDYAALYGFAETLFRRKDGRAAQYYQVALKELDRTANKDTYALSMYATILHRLGRDEEAVAMFRELLQAYPDNKTLKADFVNLLLEMKEYDQAAVLLGKASPASGGEGG